MTWHRKWDDWPCTHACTAFFHVDPSVVRDFVPEPLELDLKKGRATIELGYVRFRAGIHGLPATEEFSWAIGVKPRTLKNPLAFAFFEMNLSSNNPEFIHYNAAKRFRVHDETLRFETDLDRRVYQVSDSRGPIATLRNALDPAIPLPVFPTTEVWTQIGERPPEVRYFGWKGKARMRIARVVAATMHAHPFFDAVDVTRVNPLPYQVFSSARIARRAMQRFTEVPDDPV